MSLVAKRMRLLFRSNYKYNGEPLSLIAKMYDVLTYKKTKGNLLLNLIKTHVLCIA